MLFVPARLLSGRTVRRDRFKDGLAILVHVALNLRDALVGNLIVQGVVVVVCPQLADDIQHDHGHVKRMTGLYTRQCLLSYQTDILRREQDECRFERRAGVQAAIARSSQASTQSASGLQRQKPGPVRTSHRPQKTVQWHTQCPYVGKDTKEIGERRDVE